MLKVPFIISQPLTVFDIRWVTSHWASGLQKSTSPPHISVTQVPYRCPFSSISPYSGSIPWLWRTLTLIQRINRCPAIRKTDALSFGNLDKTPIKTQEFDAREFKLRSIDFNVRFVGEIKEAIFCLPLFIFIIYCTALRFLAILSVVWKTFLKIRNAVVIWQSADEAYRVHHGTVVA